MRGALVARRRAAERLLGQDREEGELAAVRLIAAADGDSQAPLDGAVEELLNWARDHGIEADAASGIDAARVDRSPNAPSHSSPTSTARLLEQPLAEGHGVGALLRTIRSQRFRDEGTEEDERFVLAFGLRLVELAQDGEQITSARVLRAFARGRRMWDTGAPMVWLADGLERHGETGLAAQALVYSWTCAKQHWWQRTGGAALSQRIERARRLDRSTADATLMAELAYIVRTDPRQVGLTQGLVGLLASLGDADVAFAAWDAAAEVVFARLPALGHERPTFAPLADLDPHLGLEAALAQLLAARLCHPRSDVAREAVAGVLRVAQDDSETFIAALAFLLQADTSILVLEAALQVAVASPHASEVAQALTEPLSCLAREQSFMLRRHAATLLSVAGRPVPPYRSLVLTPRQLAVAEGATSRAVRSLDWENRLSRLEDGLPGLGGMVVSRFERWWRASKVAKAREGSRWDLRRDRVRRVPAAQARMWTQEIFEAALQDELSLRLDAEDADEEIHAAIHRELIPPVRLMAGWTGSRTTRPSPQPEAGETVAPLSDGRYAGWCRLAWLEEELIPGESYREDVKQRRFALGAVVFSDQPIPPNAAPVGSGRSTDWWAAGSRRGEWPGYISPDLPFVAIAFQRDPWGSRELLLLPEPVAASLPLRPDRVHRLALLDDEGHEAVRLRRWWVRSFAQDGAASWVPRVRGCDLLVRDDVWQAIEKLALEGARWAHLEKVTEAEYDDDS
jgi:hypothetical protein